MKVIEPTPSQAAVVLKNYFRSLGFDVTLANAQEALARSRGYADWNTLASQVAVRGSKKKEAPSPVNAEERVLQGPFAVFVNGGYYDTLALYEEATSLAEVFAAAEDEDRSEPFDCVTIEDALGNVVDKFIQSHTRIRVYLDGAFWEFFAGEPELNRALALLVDDDECEIRVDEYRLKANLGVVGITESPEPSVLYEYKPTPNTVAYWQARTTDGNAVLKRDGVTPLEFTNLTDARNWFIRRLEQQGIDEEPTLTPKEDLGHWEASVRDFDEKVLLVEQRRLLER